MLAGLEGVKYANIIDGASDTVTFLQFFGEALQASDIVTGRPALEVGDIIIMDICPIHLYDGGDALDAVLQGLGMELVYTPTYSPDLNPVEFLFLSVNTP